MDRRSYPMVMERYRNRSGNSGIAAYEIRAAAIVLRFNGGGTYLYDRSAPGADHVAAMQRLARAGEGLTTYVNQQVRGKYADRLDRGGVTAPGRSRGRKR
jgi:hypothetical protein